MENHRILRPSPPLYDYGSPPISDDDFKQFHTIDRKLYGKLINVLGRDPTESMKVMAFFHWIEGVAKDQSFVEKLYDFTPPLLDKIVDEALLCVKCTEDDRFNGYGSPDDIFLIPNILKRKFILRYFHENRATAFPGITNSLKTVCFRAFDDIDVVNQPNYYTRASLAPRTNAMNTDFTTASLIPPTNPRNTNFTRATLVPTTNPRNTDFTRANLVPTPNVINIDHEMRRVSTINNPSQYGPIGTGGGGGSDGDFLGSMIPSENKIEELVPHSSRIMPLINANHFLGGASNIEELGRAANRMVPMNPSHVPGVGALNIQEFARADNRMVPMNPNLVPGVGSGVGASNIDELARTATGMVPMNPIHVPGVGAGGEMHLRCPYVIPNQMVHYMPPYAGGSAMNLLPPPIPYNAHNFSHASSSGSGYFLPQMLPGPSNYHHDIVGAQAMNMDLAEMFNNFNIFDVKEEIDTAPEDRTVFLTFSKGYPISEAEVMEFFTRKFGEDNVLAVYMQEVPEDEQALYARLVTRSPATLEAIVDGGKAKYNINGKHVWARKYIKKQDPKIMFVGQNSSSVPSTSH